MDYLEGDDGDFDYSDDGDANEDGDADVENQYYTAKGGCTLSAYMYFD